LCNGLTEAHSGSHTGYELKNILLVISKLDLVVSYEADRENYMESTNQTKEIIVYYMEYISCICGHSKQVSGKADQIAHPLALLLVKFVHPS
jgi:hypothetical protein